jgi:hypothetical protein
MGARWQVTLSRTAPIIYLHVMNSSNNHHRVSRRSGLFRPFAFTTLMVYGLTCFMMGQQDWRHLHRLPGWAEALLIICGVLLGSAAIRVFLRRKRAFGQSLFCVTALLVGNLFIGLIPGVPRSNRELLARLVLSGIILWLVRQTDKAVPPPQQVKDPQP